MALKEIQNATSTAQLVGTPAAGTATVQVVPGDGEAASGGDSTNATTGDEVTQTTQTDVTGVATNPTPTLTVDIPPEALRQITSLSSTNRQLKKQIDELNKKITGLATPEDTSTKLKRLEELEGAFKSPKKFFQMSGKTLEDVSKEYYETLEETAQDPRVDALATTVEAQAKELERLKAEKEAEKAQSSSQAHAQATQRTLEHIKGVITGNAGRYALVSKIEGIETKIFEAAAIVAERDYGEKKDAEGNVTRVGKAITRDEATKILHTCLKRAEAIARAEKALEEEDQDTSGQGSRIAVGRKGGIQVLGEVNEPTEAPQDGRRSSGFTIDANRTPTRTVTRPERGPTDVRTARQRMLKIATGE